MTNHKYLSNKLIKIIIKSLFLMILYLFIHLFSVRPLLVEILAREQPLSVGQEAELACRAVGARPPAIITWWLNDKQMIVSDPQKVSLNNFDTV